MALQRNSGGQTVERERYNLAERLINGVLTGSQVLGLPVTCLKRDALLKAAKRRTKLSDTGEDPFLDGLDRILAEAAGRYTPFGNALLRNFLVKALEIRLRSIDYIKRHPEVLDIQIVRPIVILGFPRSGTTLLQNLLATSVGRAPLEFWELMSVTPVNEADLEADKAQRVRELGRVLRLANFFVPELDRIHHSTPTTPEEDWQLLIPSLHALSFEFAYGLREYGDWLQSKADMGWAYREFRQRLQIILHQRPRQQLVLKCPDHLWFIDELLSVLPDACIVQTQRDPVRCITSYTSMIALQERMLTGRIQWKPLAKRLGEIFLSGARRAQAARARRGEAPFYDASFDQLVRDPSELVRKISDHFGIAAPSSDSLSSELAKPRADRPGAHRYSYDRLGIDPDALRATFGWPDQRAPVSS